MVAKMLKSSQRVAVRDQPLGSVLGSVLKSSQRVAVRDQPRSIKMNRLAQATLLLITVVFCRAVNAGDNIEHISIYKLISNPSQFHGEVVSTAGVLGMSQDGDYLLFTDEASYENEVLINSVLLAVNPSEAQELSFKEGLGKFVLIIGIYNQKSPRLLHSGVIQPKMKIKTYPLIKAFVN